MLYNDFIAETAVKLFIADSHRDKEYNFMARAKIAVRDAKTLGEALEEQCGEEFFYGDNDQSVAKIGNTLKEMKELLEEKMENNKTSIDKVKTAVDAVAAAVSSISVSSPEQSEENNI